MHVAPRAAAATVIVGASAGSGAAVTYRSLGPKADELSSLIEELDLKDPVRLYDPRGFRVDGPDRIAVTLDFNPAYMRSVRVLWVAGSGETPATLYEGPGKALIAGQRLKIDSTSPALAASGPREFTAELIIEPYPEVLARPELATYFPKEVLRVKRQFARTPRGLVPDPIGGLPAGSIDQILTDADAGHPNRYMVLGRLNQLPAPGGAAYLVIEATASDQLFVGAALQVAAGEETFMARAFLGSGAVDQMFYGLRLAVAERPDAERIGPKRPEEVVEFEKGTDWAKLGYHLSPLLALKRNNSQDGLWKP
jgi:hypothetical protein